MHALLVVCFLLIQSVYGIEVDFSINDLELNTQYDVDDSIYVYEEASGDPLQTTITDHREVNGGGKKNLKQGFSSAGYSATSGVKADSGSIESTAYLTTTSLSATQKSNIAGSLAQSYLTGYQDYFGGMAFTGQFVGVENGILSTVQSLSLGRSIYSTQYFQASGINPLAIGYALVGSHVTNSFDGQGAFIVAGAFREGSISGSIGTEVVKVPDAAAIDPIAYGSNIVAQGDEAAVIIAGAGALKGSWSQNQFANFNGLEGRGAFAGVVGIGKDSLASVDYIQAQTYGYDSSAFEVDAKAKGDEAAIVAAGAGKFNQYAGFGFGPNSLYAYNLFDMQGAIAGATAIGDDSRAKASWIGAITDGEMTSAAGEHLKAKSDGFTAVGAGAGSLYMDRRLMQSPFFAGSFDSLGTQGALAGAVAGGENSRASANFVGAKTDGETTFAEGHGIRARGDEFAGIVAGAGSFYQEHGQMQSPFFVGSFDRIGIQGALAGAVAGGENSRASANFVGAKTDGETTFAEGHGIRARGDEFAGIVAGAGSFYQDHGQMQSPFFAGSFDSLGIQGAIAGAAAGGDDSRASADFIGAKTDGETTFAEGHGIRASGDEFAGILAGAGSLYMDHGLMQSPFFAGSFDRLGIQGALAGAAAGGDDSEASANFVGALTDGENTFAEGYGLQASGDEFAATGAGAVSIRKEEYSINPVSPNDFQDTQGAIVADVGLGEDSFASADYVGGGTNGDQTSAVGRDLMARGKRSAHAIAGAGDEIALDKGVLKIEHGSATGLNSLDNGAVRAALMYAGTGDITESHGERMQARGDESALAYTASGDKLTVWADSIRVKDGTLAGLGAKGAMSQVQADELFSDRSDAISTSHVNNLLALGEGAIAATASGEKIDLMLDKAEVDTGSLTGVAANGGARVTSANLASFKSAVSDLSTGEMLTADGDKSAVLATGNGAKVTIKADEDEGRARVEQGTIAGVAAYKNARVSGYELASGEIELDIGALVMDGEGSLATGLSGSGEKSAALASGAGDSVVIVADDDKGRAKVEKGSLAGLTAFKNAQVSGGLLASGDTQLAIGPLVLDGKGSLGTGLSASGDDSASGASGFGDEVFAKSNNQMGEAKVTKGGIVGMAAHESAQIGVDLLGSAGVTDGTVAGWIGLNPSATGTLSALGTGFGSEVNVEADAAIVETTLGSIIGLTASGQNSRTSADRIGGYEIAGVSTLGASNVLDQGDFASAASATGLSAAIESNKVSVNTGSVVGMVAAGGQVEAQTLGTSSLYPSGTYLAASGTSATAASATGLGTTVIEANKVTINTGSLVGLATENGQVTADSLGYNGISSIGYGLAASGSKSVIAAGAGNKITLQPGSAKVESITIDPNGVLLALGAGGSSQLSAASLEAGKDLTTSVAKGSELFAYGQDYSMIAAASGGSLVGGTITNFQPSSGVNPYYGMTIPRGAYGGARTDGGTVTANQLMAKSEVTSVINTNYIIGGLNAGTTTKDYATMQAIGAVPVVFAATKPSGAPQVATKLDTLPHTIWAYRNAIGGNKEVN
jgi:hypothetical protein